MDALSDSRTLAEKTARFLEEHKGQDTVALSVREQSSFTDFFVIATVTSEAHMRGLYRNVLDFLSREKAALHPRRKIAGDEGWLVVDCGTVVIHLMTQEKRIFYDLERLWFEGEVIFHSSSKSSS